MMEMYYIQKKLVKKVILIIEIININKFWFILRLLLVIQFIIEE